MPAEMRNCPKCDREILACCLKCPQCNEFIEPVGNSPFIFVVNHMGSFLKKNDIKFESGTGDDRITCTVDDKEIASVSIDAESRKPILALQESLTDSFVKYVNEHSLGSQIKEFIPVGSSLGEEQKYWIYFK